MLLFLPFSQQAPSVRCALHGRARGPAENSDRGGDSAIPPLWKNAGASIGLSNGAAAKKRRNCRVSHNPMDGETRDMPSIGTVERVRHSRISRWSRDTLGLF